MPKKIQEDHKHFRDKVERLVKKGLRKKVKTGKLFGDRGGKNGKFIQPIDRIDIPHFVYGEQDDGVGRGDTKEGQVIRDDGQPGDKPQAGQEDGDSIRVAVDMDDVLDLLQEDLQLPNLKPKSAQTFEDIQYKYNSLSKIGPESLRHNRKTWQEAMKRMASTGDLGKLHVLPGFDIPVRMITPIQSDKRYRQRKEIHIPCNNAAIIYMRDGSGSVNEEKRSIINDIAYWAEKWIGRYYKKVGKCYIWHDNKAQEVDQQTWYQLQGTGGTTCSSAFKEAIAQFEYRFPPHAWNIYPFYFTDGENWGDDNEVMVQAIKEGMPASIVNMLAIVQVLCWNYGDSVKKYVDDKIESGFLERNYIRTVSVGAEESPEFVGGGYSEMHLSDDERYEAIKNVFRKLFGNPNSGSDSFEGL